MAQELAHITRIAQTCPELGYYIQQNPKLTKPFQRFSEGKIPGLSILDGFSRGVIFF